MAFVFARSLRFSVAILLSQSNHSLTVLSLSGAMGDHDTPAILHRPGQIRSGYTKALTHQERCHRGHPEYSHMLAASIASVMDPI